MNKNKKNKIAIIGQSQKFITEVKKNYKNSKINIIPWRQVEFYIKKKVDIYNMIFVCGFDFSIYTKDYIFFEKKNIFLILQLLRKISNQKTKIIYINTQIKGKIDYTYSRYKYAKQKLAYLISKEFKKSVIFNADLIKEGNTISINSNFFSKFLFYFFSKFNLIKTIDIKIIFIKINDMINHNKFIRQKNIKGYFLKIPRTQLIDRALYLMIK